MRIGTKFVNQSDADEPVVLWRTDDQDFVLRRSLDVPSFRVTIYLAGEEVTLFTASNRFDLRREYPLSVRGYPDPFHNASR